MNDAVLVTVVSPRSRRDLMLPVSEPVGELIPRLVDLCIDVPNQTPTARWALGLLGRPPFPPTSSLEALGVGDGALLYVRDMTSPVPPPPPPTGPPAALAVGGSTTGPGAITPDRAGGGDGGVGRPMAMSLSEVPEAVRWGLDPDVGVVLIGAAAVVLLGLALVVPGLTGHVDMLLPAIGIWAAGALVGWWLGLLDWASHRLRLGFLAALPPAPGLAHHRDRQAALRSYHETGLRRINAIVEEFVYDFGRWLAGQQPEMPYATMGVALMLRDMVAPILRGGDVIIPTFGAEADVRVDWKPSEPDRPVVATALFDDNSTRVTATGERIPMPRRQMRLTLRINGSLTLITDATLTPV